MTTPTTSTNPTTPRMAGGQSVFWALARREIVGYARHPLFLFGAGLTLVVVLLGPDPSTSSLFHVIVPAAGLGIFGVLVMTALVRRSDRAFQAAGSVATTERTRTYALATATVVPFSCGLAFFAWAVWAYHHQPPLPSTMPFGDVGDGWVYAVLFALGAIASAGGPILGLVVARWLDFRGSAAIVAVALVLVTIVMQGLIEPLRYIRVVMPWTYFGGPYGVDGEAERWLILTGSPQWYCAYLVMLCVAGIVIAALHDRDHARAGLVKVLVVVLALAAGFCLLAMTGGVQEVMVNPLPPPPAP